MKNFFKTKYRVVKDTYSGFEVQFRPWYWPVWLQCSFRGGWGINTCRSLDEAKEFIRIHRQGGAVYVHQ